MADSRSYLRPAGLLWGEAADTAVAAGHAGRLAGGEAAWTLGEIITRRSGKVSRQWFSRAEIAGHRDPAVAALVEAVEADRPVAGQAGGDAGPVIMGIVNVTPDSFSDGGQNPDPDSAIAHGRALAAAGAGILDIGGESTRPGSGGVSLAEERARVIPVVVALVADGHCVSIDTRKPEIMAEAVAAGATIINDVTALTHSPDSRRVAADLGVPVMLMHMQGTPETMQDNPTYDDVVLDVADRLGELVDAAVDAGVSRDRLLVDPGIGFGKTKCHNLELIERLSLLHGLGLAIVFGASRKGFTGALTRERIAARRVPGSLGAAIAAVEQGAQIIRVHDVRETVQMLQVWRAIQSPLATEA